MIKKMKNSFLFKTFLKMPLWGKVAVPAVAIFLVVSVFKAMSWAFYLGILAIAAYFILSGFLYFKDRKKE